MATNIELKARCADLDAAARRAESWTHLHLTQTSQKDTYFNTSAGRLKLREIDDARAELICYHRRDDPSIRQSDYSILSLTIEQGRTLVDQLTAALGVRVIVAKTRRFAVWQEVRIHLDRVAGLGEFIEFEGLVTPDSSAADAARKVAQLRAVFQIADADLIATSYSDLLLSR